MTDNISAPRRGRPRKSLFASKPAVEAGVPEEIGETPSVLPTPPRPAARPPIKAESPREKAARRVAEIREHNKGRMDEGTDEFYIDPAMVPDGWTYEWKMRSVLGAEDPSYDVVLRRKGWEPVDAGRHPEMMPRGTTAAEITRKGMVLMERPKELTDEMQDIAAKNARDQVATRAGEIDPNGRGGLLGRSDANARVNIKKSYSPMTIPD